MTFLKDMLLPHFIQFLELPTTVSLFLCPQYVVWEVSKWLQLGQSSSPDFSGSLVRKFSFFSSQKTIEKGAQDFQVRYSLWKIPLLLCAFTLIPRASGGPAGQSFPLLASAPQSTGTGSQTDCGVHLLTGIQGFCALDTAVSGRTHASVHQCAPHTSLLPCSQRSLHTGQALSPAALWKRMRPAAREWETSERATEIT